jgi:hypothetical protein
MLEDNMLCGPIFKKHISDINQKEKIQTDPFLKSMMDPYSLEE